MLTRIHTSHTRTHLVGVEGQLVNHPAARDIDADDSLLVLQVELVHFIEVRLAVLVHRPVTVPDLQPCKQYTRHGDESDTLTAAYLSLC